MANLVPCQAVILSSTGAPSVEKLHRVGVQLGHRAGLPSVILHALSRTDVPITSAAGPAGQGCAARQNRLALTQRWHPHLRSSSWISSNNLTSLCITVRSLTCLHQVKRAFRGADQRRWSCPGRGVHSVVASQRLPRRLRLRAMNCCEPASTSVITLVFPRPMGKHSAVGQFMDAQRVKLGPCTSPS
jgi:hypothetical protein